MQRLSDSTREETLFALALATPPPERTALLERECAGDPALLRRVEALLAAHERPATGWVEPGEATVKADTVAQESDEAVGQTLGRYRLLERLGEGGCGVVYVAEQTEPVRRRVALKVIKLGMDTKAVVTRFEAERQALAMMDHPNIARVLDAGATEQGRPYFVMELVRGIPITAYCNQSQLGTRQRLDLFIKVCHAIQHAHQKGIIHRDIKPSNILVTLHDGVPVPKVIDFGIAKATEGRLTDATVYTQLHHFIGTPAYMSPEQAEMSGLDIDTRADIYSLGVLLYEMLTGRTPFDGKELMAMGLDAMRRTIRENEPPRPSTRLSQTLMAANARRLQSSGGKSWTPEEAGAHSRRLLRLKETVTLLRGDLDWIVMRCLEKDRTRRYDTANALAMDIHRHLNNEPVAARPPSATYRLQKAWRRNKVVYSAAFAVALALMIGGILSLWQAAVARQAQVSAEAAGQQAITKAQEAETERRSAERNAREAGEQMHLALTREDQMLRRAYAADVNLAHQAVQNNNFGRALDLLNRYRPVPGKPDLRGWEWRYLWSLCRSDAEFELCRLGGSEQVLSVALSPDRGIAAVAGHRGSGVLVFDFSTRRQIATLAPGEGFCHVAFSPDSRRLAFSSKDSLGLWDCSSRSIVAQIPAPGTVVSLGFSGDSRRLITYSLSQALTISDAESLRTLKAIKIPKGEAWLGSAFAFTPDLKTAVHVAGGDAIVAVDLETGGEKWRFDSGVGRCQALAISPDQRLVAAGFGMIDARIRLFDMETGEAIASLPGHRAWISSLVFWPDGSTLASASADQTIRIWDVDSRQPLRAFQGHGLEVWSLALSTDARILLSGGKDGSVLVWDAVRDPHERHQWRLPGSHAAWAFASDGIITVEAGTGRVLDHTGDHYEQVKGRPAIGDGGFPTAGSSFAFSPSGNFLGALSTDGILRVLNLRQNEPARQFPTGLRNGILAAWSDDAARAWTFSGAAQGGIDIKEWDIHRGELSRSFPGVQAPIMLQPSRWLFGRETTGTPLLRDLQSGGISRPSMFDGPLSNLYGGPSASPDGRLLAICHDSGVITIWDTRDLTANPSPRPLHTLGGILMSFSDSGFSADGGRFFGTSHGTEAITVWGTTAFHPLLTLGADAEGVRRPSLSPDGRDLAAMDVKGRVLVWRAASRQETERGEKP